MSDERTFGLVSNGNTEVEHAIIVLGREYQVVLAVFLYDIVIPHLFLSPCHILDIENHAMVGSLVVLHIIEREYVVVLHLEVTAIVVEGMTCLTVVGGVNIQFTVKHVG